MKRLIFIFLALVFSTNACFAGVAEYKGVGQASYSGWLDKDEKLAAETAALEAALEGWISENHDSHYANYLKVKDEMDSHIRDYVIKYVVLDSEKDSGTKRFKVVVRATINETKVLNYLINKGEQSPTAEQAYLTFVFVARELESVSSQHEKTNAISDTNSKRIEKAGSDSHRELSEINTNSTSTKSRETRYNDQRIWRVSTANEINVAIGDVFTDANYLVIDADLLEEETSYLLDVENFIRDYEQGNDVTAQTRREALKGLKSLDDPIDYLAIGTLDVDEQLQDEVTGNIKVPVSVTAQILAIHKRGAAVAKVGPVQYFGLGPTAIVAKNNALKLAAEDVAKQLVAKLSAKNIR